MLLHSKKNSGGYLGQHPEQQVREVVRDLGLGGEAQGLMLHHLEQLEHRRRVEGDAAKDKGVQAGPQGIHICGTAPAHVTGAVQAPALHAGCGLGSTHPMLCPLHSDLMMCTVKELYTASGAS